MKFMKLLNLYADLRAKFIETEKKLEDAEYWLGKERMENNALRKDVGELEAKVDK